MKDNEVADNLEEFKERTLPDLLSVAMANACSIVQTAAKEKAPHDTGDLMRSIDFEVDDEELAGVIFANTDYAPYVEIGTGIYSSKGTGRQDVPWRYKGSHGWVSTYGNKPQPFLKPAAYENKTDIIECFEGLV